MIKKKMSLQKRLGLLSILAFIGAFVILELLNIRFVTEPPLVLPLLNTMLIGAVCIVAAYIASKIYLSSNMFGILLIGDGMLLFGLGASVAGWLRFLTCPAVLGNLRSIDLLHSDSRGYSTIVFKIQGQCIHMCSPIMMQVQLSQRVAFDNGNIYDR